MLLASPENSNFLQFFFSPILFQILIIQAFINIGQQIISKIFAFRIKRQTLVWFQLPIITRHMFYLWIKYERQSQSVMEKGLGEE